MKTITKTNNHWREFLGRSDVPASVLASQFDHHSDDTSDSYMRYHGFWYHLDMFMRLPTDHEWHGSHACSAFSGTLIRFSDDGETYQIASIRSVGS